MARPRPFNRTGIWGIASLGAPTVTATEVTYNFESHPFVNAPYNGLLLVNLTGAVPTGTTGTLPVVFKTGNNAARAVTKTGGVPLTAADITGTGYYLCFYDNAANVFQALTALV